MSKKVVNFCHKPLVASTSYLRWAIYIGLMPSFCRGKSMAKKVTGDNGDIAFLSRNDYGRYFLLAWETSSSGVHRSRSSSGNSSSLVDQIQLARVLEQEYGVHDMHLV